ncbi:LysR family transcriptional regulator [Labilithrix luteola]|nr:LysR family transcriptional regulator [Labilithrix luteola]
MFDWDDLRYVLAIARHGTLSSAARRLAVTQPTMGRRLDAFEKHLGTRLFLRTPEGFQLTAAGRELLAHAERMEGEALAAFQIVAGRDSGVVGMVRVTTTKWFSSSIVAPILARLPERYPGLAVDLVASDGWLNLPRRDVDIALRFARFEHQDVLQRSVARIGFGLYASARYLDRRGMPDFTLGCPGHAVITMSDDVENVADVPWLRAIAHAASIAFRSNGRDAHAIAAAEGAGLACLPRHLAERTPGLVRLAPPSPPPARRAWLGIHRDGSRIPRIRAVMDALTRRLARLEPELADASDFAGEAADADGGDVRRKRSRKSE